MGGYFWSLFLIFLLFPSYSVTITTEYLSENCNKTAKYLDGTLVLEPTQYLWYSAFTSCSYNVVAGTGQQILLSISMFDLEPKVAGVCVDYINVYDGNDITGTLLNPSPLCDTLPRLPNTTYKSTGNAMTIHLFSDDSGEGKGFEFVFVPVTTGSCSSSQTSCTNTSACIDASLLCNAIDECGDGTDEDGCNYVEPQGVKLNSSYRIIVGLVLGIPGGIIVLSVIAVLIWRHHRWRLYARKPLTVGSELQPTTYETTYPVTKLYYKDKYHSIYENPAFQKAELIRHEEEMKKQEEERKKQEEEMKKQEEEMKKQVEEKSN